jgi:hypothetical protein
MKMSFTVGKNEPHIINYSFNQFWGITKISVDEKRIKVDLNLFSHSLTKQFEFYVHDKSEVLTVTIQRHRKLLFAGFRKQLHQVLVNDEFLLEREGY